MTVVQLHPDDGNEPVFDLTAEVSVLGGCLIDRDALAVVDGLVTPDMFFREPHRIMFRAMQRVYARGDAVDVITLTDDLREHEELEQAGGVRFVAELLDAVPTAANITAWASIVRRDFERRQIISALHQAASDVATPELPASDAFEMASDRLEALRPQIATEQSGAPWFRTLDQYDGDVAMPTTLLHGLAWKGLVTLFSGEEKAGKSTVTRIAAAAASRGDTFLGHRVPRTTVFYLDIDDPTTGWKLKDLNPHEPRLIFEDRYPSKSQLVQAIIDASPGLVILDNLGKLAAHWDPDIDSGNATRWNHVIDPVLKAIHEVEAAGIWLHHLKKDGSKYRDSTAIGAAFDVLASFKEQDSYRVITTRGRVRASTVTLQYRESFEGEELNIVGGNLPPEARLVQQVWASPGQSITATIKAVGMRKQEGIRIVRAMQQRGELRVVEGDRGAHLLYPMDPSSPELDIHA